MQAMAGLGGGSGAADGLNAAGSMFRSSNF
jgi:hypothetical protein